MGPQDLFIGGQSWICDPTFSLAPYWPLAPYWLFAGPNGPLLWAFPALFLAPSLQIQEHPSPILSHANQKYLQTLPNMPWGDRTAHA